MWIPRLDVGSDRPFFRQITDAIAADLASGRLVPGARLPTHRELADRLGVARGTVARAYDLAEHHGLIHGDVGRGTFVQGTETAARRYASLLDAPVIAGDLSGNHPLEGIDPDPASAFAELALRADRRALLRYQSPLGIRRHRAAGAAWVRRLGLAATEDDVILCAGAQHALFVLFAHLLGPDETLLVEEWSYPGLHGIAETLRLRLEAVAMDREGVDPDALERACAGRPARTFYCMPTAHNPLGVVLSAGRRAAIADVARRHGLRIVEDAANQLFVPDAPPPLAAYAGERTYFVASTAKILGAGLRVAFVLAPRSELAAIARHVWSTVWMVSPFGAEIVSSWLEQGIVDRTLRRKRAEAVRRQRLARRALGGHALLGHPATLHLWLRLPRGHTAAALVAEAQHHGLAVTPASAFWMRRTPPEEAIRIALGGIDSRKELARGLGAIAGLLAPGSARQRSLPRAPR
ncbi:MAG: PLP-dependent aminotransferase family protein [Deltaproteobacteria bacterium]|nr:PLP-dependent aminotransferase family protein [Deltaproteobacteria bacterium]